MAINALDHQPNRTTLLAWRLLIAGVFCLLTACGGGGGGGGTTASPPASPPSITLSRSGVTDPSAGIYSGNAALLVPTYTYGAATIGWTDASGQAQTLQIASSGTPVQVNPTQTTVYTLTVRYQDPTTIRPQELAATATITVAVKATEDLAPTLVLASSTNSVLLGASATLTPTFSWTGGTITKSVVNDGTKDIAVSSGTPIVVSPTQTATFTLKLEYLDQRVIPAISKSSEAVAVVAVSLGAGKVSPGSNLTNARSNHTAVLLPNNLVLVSGGSSGSAVLKSTELYDPVKNTWSAGADMKTARTGHTAVLLLNGKVLVAGGFDGKAALATAEIYDPASNTWTATTGPMAYSHNYHTATLLTSGKVLIAGGVLGPAIFADATITEVYDPTLGTFSAGPNLPEPRQGHTATVLQNGKVLFAGNSNGTATSARLLTYTAPSTFEWTDDTTPTGSMATGRWNHAATLVASGKVLVTGGFGTNPRSAELYNPTTNLWEPAGTMANSRALHTSTLLRDGKVLIVGGYDGTNALNSIEVYDPTVSPATAGWSTADQKVLNATRATHTSTLLSNGSVFVVGTYLQSGGTASATTDIWAP